MDIREFKAQNPDYQDVPDLELADALHAKFYSDVPRDQFLQQVGVAGPGGNFATNMPRDDYAKQFVANNPQADQGALDTALAQYDQAHGKRTEARGNAVQDRFKELQSPAAMFDARLNAKLQGPAAGVMPSLPAKMQPDVIATPKPAPTLAQEIGGNVTGGLLGGLAGAGASLASMAGANDTAAGLDAARAAIAQKQQDELGGDTVVGRASSLVGGVAPALLAPEEFAPQLLTNAGLFAAPAVRDTYNAKTAQGQSPLLAGFHAAEAGAINLVAPSLATRGIGGIIGRAAGEGGLLGAAGQLGAAAGEGLGFSALNTVSDKATDLIAGQKNDNAWIDPKDMAAQALGFGALRVPHAISHAVTPRATVADIAAAPDVDTAIAAAEASVPSINTGAAKAGQDTDVAALLRAIRPPEQPEPAIPAAPTGEPDAPRQPAPALPVDDGMGRSDATGGAQLPAVDGAVAAAGPDAVEQPNAPAVDGIAVGTGVPGADAAAHDGVALTPAETAAPATDPTALTKGAAILDAMTPNSVHGKLSVVDPATLTGEHDTITPEHAQFVQALGQALGKDVVFFQQEGNQRRLDGFAKTEHPDTLFVNVGKGDAAWHVVAGHEFFHQMPEDVRGAFIEAVKPLIGDAEFGALKKYINQPHLDDAGHWEEIAADLFGNRFTEKGFFDKVLANVPDRSTAVKVMDYLRSFLDKIAAVATSKRFATDQFVRDLDQIRASAADALQRYMERQSSQEGGTIGGKRVADVADTDLAKFAKSSGKAGETARAELQRRAGAAAQPESEPSKVAMEPQPEVAPAMSAERDTDHFVRVTLPSGHSMVEKVAAPDEQTAIRRAGSEHAYADKAEIVPHEEVARHYPYLLNERRQEARLSDERKATDEPAFKRWFSESKVADEHGNPTVVYHGTNKSISEFHAGRPLWVATNPNLANAFVGKGRRDMGGRPGNGSNVMPLYMHIKHPADLRVFGKPGENRELTLREFAKEIDPAGAVAARLATKKSRYIASGGVEGERPLDLDEAFPLHRIIDMQQVIASLRESGYDGYRWEESYDYKGGEKVNGRLSKIAGVSDTWAAFTPEQVKSAIGNNGQFDPANPDIRFSQQRADDLKDKLSRMIAVPKGALHSAVFQARMMVMPMAAGSEHAMAFAKDFANNVRKAQVQWQAMDKMLVKHYSEEQLTKMWQAADEENDLRREGKTSGTLGLASLPANQRAVVELLHDYGQELWAKAKAAGMVEGDGVAFWTPRMAARVVEEGASSTLGSAPGEFSKEARNLRTSASSTKKRNHDTTAESEAALKAKFGDDAAYVKNIRVMPLAMAQLEKAIAGRTLINQIKAHGQVAGQDLVRDADTGDKNYDTFDHPAMKRWAPKMDWQPADEVKLAMRGHEVKPDGVYTENGDKLASYRVKDGVAEQLQPVLDANGQPVMESRPLFVHKDFLGPLRAVFNKEPNIVYRGLMELKSLSMNLIMLSPLTHNMVIWGKALPSMVTAMGWKGNLKNLTTGGIYSYVVGHAARNDHALMNDLVAHGLVPMGGRGMNPDLPAIADGIKPGRSVLAKAIGAVFDVAHSKAGDAARKTIDAVGHFWHETLLWDRIGDMQAGMAVQMRNHFMDKGIDQDTATRIATFFANRYAGAIPQEAISSAAHAVMNVTLFSKSFTLTNAGAMKDPFVGLPKEVRAQIRLRTIELQKALGKTDIEAVDAAGHVLKQAQSVTRQKAAAILLVDFAAMAALTSMTQAYFAGQNGQQWWNDLKDRATALGAKLDADNPLAFLGPRLGKIGVPLAALRHPFDNLQALSQTADNPHGKEDRVRVGEDEHGNSYYLRLPTGKVVEEMKQYLGIGSGLHLLHNKMSPLARATSEVMENQDFQGRRVFKESDTALQQAGAVAGHILKAQVPFDDLVALQHVMEGDTDAGGKLHLFGRDWNMDEAKLLGTATGLSVSKLSGGDAVAEMRYASREHEAGLRDVLPDVRDLVRRGMGDEAEQKLVDAGQSPQEARRMVRSMENPDRITARALQQFGRHASEEEQARLDRIRSR